MKRSPNTRVSSPTILNLNAFSYHSAVLRGSDALRWMWLIRNAMARASRWPRRACVLVVQDSALGAGQYAGSLRRVNAAPPPGPISVDSDRELASESHRWSQYRW